MSTADFTLSCFGDEIDPDLETQLRLMKDLGIGHLELRAAWGKNVLRLDDDEVARARRICDQYSVAVSSIGSPVGKTPILDPIEKETANLERIFRIAEALDTRTVRVFSFYPPDTSSNAGYDKYVDETVSRLSRLAEMARREGFYLMHENERDIVGDTPERCYAIVKGVNSPHLRMLWDPANFVYVDVLNPMDRGWSVLAPHVSYIHIKDAAIVDGKPVCRAAGEGVGQVRELLVALRQMGYRGFLAIEPHLALAGRGGGFSGPSGMTYAVNALRRLLAETESARDK